ncbi:MAG: Rpn family recombination-promoting nuclease/putative transposase [Selenomonadaceae bacterium]|nr:Rpn family recombination-promoting nuclease/putative transposase [Selenomonadaceae bacterium]MBP3722209.1 Rpn family recombination-promoting nuclease/putative transposase [Selenomonadaceae bacterium]
MKSWEELEIEDDFLFQKVMENEEICKTFLEKTLKRKINKIRYYRGEQTVSLSPINKGVRFDVAVETADGAIIDVEMQTSDISKWLPKRTRYYQAMIDLNKLAKGSKYQNLPESYIIFVCTFDPFALSRKIYTFTNQCREENFDLNDGSTKIFYNTIGTFGELDEDIENFLNYIKTKSVKGDFTRKVAEEVEKLKAHDALKLEYMSLFARMTDEREAEKINSIRNIMKNLNLTLEKAMEALGIPKNEQPMYRETILSMG